MNPRSSRLLTFAALAVLLAATRMHHFAVVPDASWAAFFLGGLALRGSTRWAFPALMALAVAVDWLVITRSGMSFWQHYCVSPAYWMLIPAYFAMWAGGMWLRGREAGFDGRGAGLLALALPLSVITCHLLAQGSFYWIAVAEPTVAGWWKNYTDWLLPYMGSAALYVGLAVIGHGVMTQLRGVRDGHAATH
ncbi:MAG: hypothetical protein Q4F49_04145 [Pseudoxanthomonas suwonensis]|nr:hypothetical protein [Pseudoxanthomonas suwonensis]